MNAADEAPFESRWFDGYIDMKGRPCIFLFNNPAFDSPNAMDWDWVRENADILRLNDKLY